jgi:hypothetical protein
VDYREACDFRRLWKHPACPSIFNSEQRLILACIEKDIETVKSITEDISKLAIPEKSHMPHGITTTSSDWQRVALERQKRHWSLRANVIKLGV